MNLTIRPLGPQEWPALEHLFGKAGASNGCWCVEAAGAPAVEAYPVDTTTPGHTGNLFRGVASTFAKHGFAVVARPKPDRPIMRRRTAGRQSA